MILGFAHPALVVDDLEQAITFYHDMFGFREIGREGWANDKTMDRAIGLQGSSAQGVMMAGFNCFLEIWQYDSPTHSADHTPQNLTADAPGLRHIAFYVDDLQFETKRFLSLGGQELGRAEQGAVYLRDPFGNIIELAEIPNAEEHLARLPGVSHAADGSLNWQED
jgi:catechol 2,3-dioxygenase-like lactoylglutathione lyase family enzyme